MTVRSIVYLATTAVLVSMLAPACVYDAMGAEHNFTAVERLEPDMSYEACVVELSAGGAVKVTNEIALGESTWPVLLQEEPAEVLQALEAAEAETGRKTKRVVVLDRQWGLMGLGVVHLFLDESDALIGHHLFHIN